MTQVASFAYVGIPGRNEKFFANFLGVYNINAGDGDDFVDMTSADDVIFGGLGNDVLAAGFGDDTVFGDRSADPFDLSGGHDQILGRLGSDQIYAGAGNDFVNGGSHNDFADGGTGNDILWGAEGADRILGGAGSDALFGHAGAPPILGTIIVNFNGFDDAALNPTETHGGNATDPNDTLQPDDAAIDHLNGGDGNDILNGGLGADALDGGNGNDAYVVDNAGDVIVELAGQGTDSVNASVSYVLKPGVAVETLRTTAPSGTAAIHLTGNEFVNVLTGNNAANILIGGLGADIMNGGGGGNSYVVDNAGDKITDTAGIDNLSASVSYTLAANVAVETLRTINAAATTPIALTGNNLANIVTGNAGSNTLNGGLGNDTLTGNAGNDILNGGAGKDTMNGNAGNDFFLFNTALSVATNVDTIVGFVVVNDTIRLENAIFTKLAAGVLNADAFFKGAAAADAEDRIIYNSATGSLSYDTNGNAAGGVAKFAQLAGGLLLTNADFVVV